MSILFSGDFHANAVNELNSITKKTLIKKYGIEKFSGIGYHIILGDAGFLWPGNYRTDLFNYKALACRPFPILCVLGNHDPILGMSNLTEADIGIGETVYPINATPFVAYLKRGKIYNIDGFKFLVLGGALSVDKDKRKAGISWWKEEYWPEKEKDDLFMLLESENSFDCVLSHTGPNHVNQRAFEWLMSDNPKKFKDEVSLLNDEIHKRIQFKEWWCGHWHQNLYYYDKETNKGYQYLYKTTKILDRVNNGIAVFNEYGMLKR
jgi:3-oxoacid CoA-transferase subunit A